VNWHITPVCNYHCRFCFYRPAPFYASLPKEYSTEIGLASQLRILNLLAKAGIQRINFAGGEPTLKPELPYLINTCHQLGMGATVVSNGTGITREWVCSCKGGLTAVKLSVESNSSDVEHQMGRGNGNHVETVKERAQLLRSLGIPIMVNSVITSLNWQEDLHPLIHDLRPIRWKVFQMLPIRGQNDAEALQLSVTDLQFRVFASRHSDLSPIVEDNRAMTGAYVMLDAIGRFFQNHGGGYVHSRSVLDIGVLDALAEAGWDPKAFAARGGALRLVC
jgi:radical S-adenosyl methionine domain-containing protein 2